MLLGSSVKVVWEVGKDSLLLVKNFMVTACHQHQLNAIKRRLSGHQFTHAHNALGLPVIGELDFALGEQHDDGGA